MKRIIKTIKAFSLLETVVILFIVAVGLLSILSLSIESLKSQSINRNTLIAYNLAQEGIELIRNVRDTNWIENTASSPVAWNRYIEGSVSGNKYRIDYSYFYPVSVTSLSETQLQLATSTNEDFYLHSTGSPDSIFKRMITIVATSTSAPSSTVTSLVQWEEKGETYQYSLETMLYDWQN